MPSFYYNKMRLSVRMLRARNGHVFYRYQADSFGKCHQNTPWEFPVQKNKIFPKPEVNHQKVKIVVFAVDIASNLD